MNTSMTEAFELTREEIPVVKLYVSKMLENCDANRDDRAPEHWTEEFVPHLRNLVARIEESPNDRIMLTPEEGEGISMLAQDVVSFRAGPQGEDEEIFYHLLDKIEYDGEGGSGDCDD